MKKGPGCFGGSSLRFNVWGKIIVSVYRLNKRDDRYQVCNCEQGEYDQSDNAHGPFESETIVG